MSHDTIVALATPFGRSGIGVIRLSGDAALEIIRKLTDDKNFSPVPRQATLKKIFSPVDRKLTDEVLITYFKSPQSFTGEDVVEISCHGSPVLIRQIIDYCLKFDARLAEAGEFSLRALASGQINLSQAEAIRDLIDARTVSSAKQAVRQLQGELSNSLQPLKDSLLDVIVILESALEFVEDDLPDYQIENIKVELTEISDELGKMASTFQVGKLLREGLRVTLVGRPNVGKSSVFNALIGHDRAIVTEIAGTTRDSLHESLTIDDIPIFLIDTAGLRETVDTVESIGVERTKRVMADSDLVIAVLDGSQPITTEDKEVLDLLDDFRSIVAVNKIDLNKNSGLVKKFEKSNLVEISAKTGEGLDKLQSAIIKQFSPQTIDETGFLVSDARHFDLLTRAKSEINYSHQLLNEKASEEIVLIGLHNAMRFLGEITGETTTEDVLTRIFSTFCVGK
ncbi:MAG: tRNA uridine-5-carboxymethylaminomethyl(34) synthesis GTPase MnmE [Pyrinomonadaceae bacterium]